MPLYLTIHPAMMATGKHSVTISRDEAAQFTVALYRGDTLVDEARLHGDPSPEYAIAFASLLSLAIDPEAAMGFKGSTSDLSKRQITYVMRFLRKGLR